MPQLRDLSRPEVFKVVYLDSNNRIIDIMDTAVGTSDLGISYRSEIIHAALQKFAKSIVCAHNHPSANITPRSQDKEFTKELCGAGKLMEIKVLDHVIIGGEINIAFADEGLMV